MIDSTKSPETARFAHKLRKLEQQIPGAEAFLEEIADFEQRTRRMIAENALYEALLRRIDHILPESIDRNHLSHIEARQLLTSVRAEVSGAQATVARL